MKTLRRGFAACIYYTNASKGNWLVRKWLRPEWPAAGACEPDLQYVLLCPGHQSWGGAAPGGSRGRAWMPGAARTGLWRRSLGHRAQRSGRYRLLGTSEGWGVWVAQTASATTLLVESPELTTNAFTSAASCTINALVRLCLPWDSSDVHARALSESLLLNVYHLSVTLAFTALFKWRFASRKVGQKLEIWKKKDWKVFLFTLPQRTPTNLIN